MCKAGIREQRLGPISAKVCCVFLFRRSLDEGVLPVICSFLSHKFPYSQHLYCTRCVAGHRCERFEWAHGEAWIQISIAINVTDPKNKRCDWMMFTRSPFDKTKATPSIESHAKQPDSPGRPSQHLYDVSNQWNCLMVSWVNPDLWPCSRRCLATWLQKWLVLMSWKPKPGEGSYEIMCCLYFKMRTYIFKLSYTDTALTCTTTALFW